MKCPVCDSETKDSVCLKCGYLLSNDYMNHRLLKRLSQQEIDDYNKAIDIQRKRYQASLNARNQNDEIKAQELYKVGYKYYSQSQYLKAEEYLRKAADLGHGTAHFYLGLMYMYGGGNEIKKNYDEARRCLEIAANKGSSTAYKCLGDLYIDGKGVACNLEIGLDMYDKAIRQGSKYALDTLVGYYKKGQGCIEKDSLKAREIKNKYRNIRKS